MENDPVDQVTEQLSTLRFKEYPSIDNHHSKAAIKQIQEGALVGECVATEKVHGSNFSFITDGSDVVCAKRSGLIESDESFCNWRRVLETYRPRVLAAFNILRDRRDGVESVVIFGELFGGTYPHPDVPRVKGVKHVQKELYYSPDIEFFGFDISINHTGFVKFDEMCDVFELAGFPLYSKPLVRGTYEDCVAFDVEDFITTIPTLLGLPPIQDNFAEGIVIRSVHHHSNVIKKKRSKFAEVAYKTKSKPVSIPKVSTVELSAEDSAVVEDLLLYVTENRLRSVLSKIGSVTSSQISQVLGLLVQDALVDFQKDNPDLSEFVKTKKRKECQTALMKAGREMILPLIDKIVSGDF
eukprot:GILI01016738.1.p1 GENE.GILI01016738.1~~GILI01016738.1.p1  ORF type:complete len:373 (-),score=77.37 GILI01016738.1:119-1180(-)